MVSTSQTAQTEADAHLHNEAPAASTMGSLSFAATCTHFGRRSTGVGAHMTETQPADDNFCPQVPAVVPVSYQPLLCKQALFLTPTFAGPDHDAVSPMWRVPFVPPAVATRPRDPRCAAEARAVLQGQDHRGPHVMSVHHSCHGLLMRSTAHPACAFLCAVHDWQALPHVHRTW